MNKWLALAVVQLEACLQSEQEVYNIKIELMKNQDKGSINAQGLTSLVEQQSPEGKDLNNNQNEILTSSNLQKSAKQITKTSKGTKRAAPALQTSDQQQEAAASLLGEVAGETGIKVAGEGLPENGVEKQQKKRQAKLSFKASDKEAKVAAINKIQVEAKCEQPQVESVIKSQQEQSCLDEEEELKEKEIESAAALTIEKAESVEVEQEEDKNDGGIPEEQNQGENSKKRGRKPKTPFSPKATAEIEVKFPSLEIPEKVREWKDRREQFVTILKGLLQKGVQEARENQIQNKALNFDQDHLEVSDEGFRSLEEELIRIGQENPQKDSDVNLSITTTSLLPSAVDSAAITERAKLALLKVLGPLIDSSPLSLEKLTQSCLSFLESKLSTSLPPSAKHILDTILSSLPELICTNAERKSFGIRSKDSILYEDEADEGLWSWELFNTSLLPQSIQKNLPYIRGQRVMIGQKVKSLEKLLSLIDKATSVEKDIPRIVEEYDKYNKVVRKENAAIQQNLLKEQQIRERERQEREKLEARERERLAKEADRLAKEAEKNQKEQERLRQIREKEEVKEREREMREKERIQKEEAKEKERRDKEEAKERERKEREEAKEKERLQKELERQQKEEERIKKEQERIEKKRQEDEEKAAKIAEDKAKKEAQLKENAKTEGIKKPQSTVLNFFNKSAGQVINSGLTLSQVVVDEKMKDESRSMNQKPIQIRSFPPTFSWADRKLGVTKRNYVSLSESSKSAFDAVFGSHVQTRQVYQSRGDLQKDMLQYRQVLPIDSGFKFARERKRCIIIDDSMMKYLGFFEKRSFILTPRNPIKKDETVIDYEMDSEEEWNEQNGEDVAAENKQDEDEDDEVEKMIREEDEEEEEAGFIVPDDYLSASELGLSQSQRSSQMAAELVERRKMLGKRYNRDKVAQNLQHYIFTLNQAFPSSGMSPRSTRSIGMMNYFEEFKAVSFPRDRQFPIRLKPLPDPAEEENKAAKGIAANNPNSINTHLAELVKMMHGSFESKQKIIDDFNQRFPDCSKKSIERKMRDLFEKDKKVDDPRQRWYATESTLIEHNLQDDLELKALFDERLQAVVDEINKTKEEQQKIKDEQARVKEEQRAQLKQQKQEEKEEKLKEQQLLKEQQRLQVQTPHKINLVTNEAEMNGLASEENNQEIANGGVMGDTESKIEAKKQGEKADGKKAEAQKKNQGLNLTKFFRPMQPEEKEKLLLNELAKVQQELKARQVQTATPIFSVQQGAAIEPTHQVKQDTTTLLGSQRTLQFKSTNSLADQQHLPQPLTSTVAAPSMKVEAIANALDELTAKILKGKMPKPNGISKPASVSVKKEEIKVGEASSIPVKQKKPRKPKISGVSSKAEPSGIKPDNVGQLLVNTLKKVRRDEADDEVMSSISSESEHKDANVSPFKYQLSMNVVAQPVVSDVLKMTIDSSSEQVEELIEDTD